MTAVKKLLTLVVTLAFAAGAVGFAAAQTPTPAPIEKAQEKKAEKPADMKSMPAKNANGAEKATSADSVVVAGKAKNKEAEWPLAADPHTSVRGAGKAVS